MSLHFNLFLEKYTLSSHSQRPEEHSRLSLATDAIQNACHGMEVQMAWVTGICAKVPLTWRHILELYRDIFMGSPWLLDQDNARSHSACYNRMVL